MITAQRGPENSTNLGWPGRSLRRLSRNGAPYKQRGVALLIVLWIVTLLGVIAGSFVLSIRTEVALARNLTESARARAAAMAGAELAVQGILNPEASQRWRVDGSVYQAVFSGTELRIAVADETGKIDLNTAPEVLLEGLLRAVELEPEERARLVDAIEDWKDANTLRRLNGAEDEDYQTAGLPYGPKNGKFENVEELLLVLGMTPALYRKLESALTVHSRKARINTAVAPPLVLLAQPGADPEQVEMVLAERYQGQVLDQSDEADELEASPTPTTDRRSASVTAAGTFSIHVEARTAGGAIERIASVVRLHRGGRGANSRPYTTLVWKNAATLMFE